MANASRRKNDAKPRPTMSDVAAAAGVSLKTVSRVVNQEPGVRRETAAASSDEDSGTRVVLIAQAR